MDKLICPRCSVDLSNTRLLGITDSELLAMHFKAHAIEDELKLKLEIRRVLKAWLEQSALWTDQETELAKDTKLILDQLEDV